LTLLIKKKKDFVKSFREGLNVLIVRRGGNVADRFLEVAASRGSSLEAWRFTRFCVAGCTPDGLFGSGDGVWRCWNCSVIFGRA
jgi:hypothetical protein